MMSSIVSTQALSTPIYNPLYQQTRRVEPPYSPDASFPATLPPVITNPTNYPVQNTSFNTKKPLWERIKSAWASEKTLGKVMLGVGVICLIDFPLELIHDIRKGLQEARKRQVVRDIGEAAGKAAEGDFTALANKNLISPWYKLLKDFPLKSLARPWSVFSAGAALFSLFDIVRFIKKINSNPQLISSRIMPLTPLPHWQNQSLQSGQQITY